MPSFIAVRRAFLSGADTIPHKILCQITGMSFWSNVFTDAGSVGRIYFILMLFGVRILYAVISRIFQDRVIFVSVAVVLVSLVGVLLGKNGWFLPWSFDLTCYVLIFYHIGYLLKRYQMLGWLGRHSYVLLPMTVVWIFMIRQGGMELFYRDYQPYLLVVAGAVSGNIILYFFCKTVFSWKFMKYPEKICSLIGKNTLWILGAHEFLQPLVEPLFGSVLGQGTIWMLLADIVIDVVIGYLVGVAYHSEWFNLGRNKLQGKKPVGKTTDCGKPQKPI